MSPELILQYIKPDLLVDCHIHVLMLVSFKFERLMYGAIFGMLMALHWPGGGYTVSNYEENTSPEFANHGFNRVTIS